MGATQSSTSTHILETPKGRLKGIQQSDLNGNPVLYRYAKIPYAKPPTGDLRWRRPQPLPSDFTFSNTSGDPGDYTAFGPICPQPVYNTDAAYAPNRPNPAPEIENVQSEDCLYLNIWVPAKTSPPPSGWPVQIHIHGGWLQIGDANQNNSNDPFDLLANSTPRIIVAPTYRLNMFGFLAGQTLADAVWEEGDPAPGNYGLWDQRAAIEWVHSNIAYFNGNPNLITVGGLSAGAHSAFLQLYHDTYLPAEKRIIKQIYLWSNAIAIQPNPSTSDTLTSQFNELATALNIPTTNRSPKEILSALRQIPSETIIATIPTLKMHTFRTSTDNDFVPSTFLSSIHNGTFTSKLASHGIRILLGEVCDEALLYKLINPPSTYTDLERQINNYYPTPVTKKLLTLTDIYDIPNPETPDSSETRCRYEDVFARITADMQVHASIRGLTHSLLHPPHNSNPTQNSTSNSNSDPGPPTPSVQRYRISFRAAPLNAWLKPEVGVCHAADTPIWWLSGYRAGFTKEDREKVGVFLDAFGAFLEGREVTGGKSPERIDRWIDSEGVTREDVEDGLWERGMRVWRAVGDVQGVTDS